MTPLCPSCEDAARHSFCQEVREGLRVRGCWAPETESDLITAVFKALDDRTDALKKIEAFGHSGGHGCGYSCTNIAEKIVGKD